MARLQSDRFPLKAPLLAGLGVAAALIAGVAALTWLAGGPAPTVSASTDINGQPAVLASAEIEGGHGEGTVPFSNAQTEDVSLPGVRDTADALSTQESANASRPAEPVAPPAPLEGFYENGPGGPLPVISASGVRPDQAYAMETASASVKEELKRKIRIAAGGLQAIYRLAGLLNIFRYGWLSFQYISHRVLRWTLAPLALITLFISNLLLWDSGGAFYRITLIGQLFFYLAAGLGWLLEKRKLRSKVLFIPYYFCVMNYAVYRGFFRVLSGRQSVLWERAKRKEG